MRVILNECLFVLERYISYCKWRMWYIREEYDYMRG